MYLYDITSNSWVISFSPPSATSTTSSESTFATNPIVKSNALAIRLETGIGVAVLISCIFATFFIILLQF